MWWGFLGGLGGGIVEMLLYLMCVYGGGIGGRILYK